MRKAAAKAVTMQRSFFHPDFTVGSGVTPDLLVRACGLYRRWGIAPRPEGLQGYYTNSPG
jgi:hypothetical protein